MGILIWQLKKIINVDSNPIINVDSNPINMKGNIDIAIKKIIIVDVDGNPINITNISNN